MHDRSFETYPDEQIVFLQLDYRVSAIWSLLLASGYLRAEHTLFDAACEKTKYELRLTNKEVYFMFVQMIEDWFREYTPDYNTFIKGF